MSRRGRGQAPSRGFSSKKFNSVLQHGFGGSSRSPIGNVGATANETEKDNRLLKSAGLVTSGSSSSIKAATTNVTSSSTAQLSTPAPQQQWSSMRMKSIPGSSKPQTGTNIVAEVETKPSKQPCANDETDMKNEQHTEDEILYPPMEFKPPKPSADSETEHLVPIKNALYAEFRAQNSYFLKSGDHLPPVFIEGFRPVNSKSIVMNWKFIPVELRSPDERKKAIERIKAARTQKRKRNASTDKPLPTTNKFSRSGALPEPVIKRLELREREESENVRSDDNKNNDEETGGKKQNEEEEEEDENKLEEDDFYDEDMDFYHFDDDEDNYGLADDDGDDEGPIY